MAHTGVDKHGHRADAQQCEDDGDQFDAGMDHQQDAVAHLDAEIVQAVGVAVAFRVELLEAQLDGLGAPGGIAAAIAGAREGHDVALVNPLMHLGGMAASGL